MKKKMVHVISVAFTNQLLPPSLIGKVEMRERERKKNRTINWERETNRMRERESEADRLREREKVNR